MINLYYHGGSANHGCEAIVRSTLKILNLPARLFTTSMEEDYQYGLDEIVEIIQDKDRKLNKMSLEYLMSAISHKITGNDYQYIKSAHKDFLKLISSDDICLSIGGDNYCYEGVDRLGYYNRMIHKKNAKTVLWGCSIEPSVLTDDVINDLKLYDLITVRESLSYEGLKKAGVIENVLLCADPAFQLEYTETDLPIGFDSNNTVGINISPLVLKYGNLIFENYVELIRYILENSNNKVLLIPHVVKQETNDLETLKLLKQEFKEDERVLLINDKNCMEIKGIISKCRFFIGARTHSTIAAYSTCVPTLAVGYSIKARGIARDIFGTEDNYVVPVQKFVRNDDLRNAYQWLEKNEMEIKEVLRNKMPEYCKKSLIARDAVIKLGGY